jgi:hypothetical protein
MIIIKSELKFKSDNKSNIDRVLESIIYDGDLDGFYKCKQIISAELVSELNNLSSLVTIKDVVNLLDGIRLSEEEVKELLIHFFKTDYTNYTTAGQRKLIQEAREFLLKYKRDIIIEEVINK